MKKDIFCSYCGAKYNDSSYPKTCIACHNQVWDNPNPVAVLLIEYDGGIYLVKRGIEPGKGLLALPGGYMVVGETWQQAAAREAMEEIQIQIDPNKIVFVKVCSSSNMRSLLIFGYVKVKKEDILPFVKNDETEERVYTKKHVPLAFPTHTEVLEKVFLYNRW